MEPCSCSYCYHEVCFHPSRGDGTGLGAPCDGCRFEGPHMDQHTSDDAPPAVAMLFLNP